MTPRMERDQIRNSSAPRGQHGQDRHGGVDPLAMDKILVPAPDLPVDARGEVVVTALAGRRGSAGR